MKKPKTDTSTLDQEMQNPAFKKAFDKSYKEFLLSELLIALMEDDETSVREIAEKAGLSPTLIQKIRSGKQTDIKMTNFVNIAQICGYKLYLEKEEERIMIEDKIVHKKHRLSFIQLSV
jgi:transcriptional regulator with XRE-family HTH domain